MHDFSWNMNAAWIPTTQKYSHKHAIYIMYCSQSSGRKFHFAIALIWIWRWFFLPRTRWRLPSRKHSATRSRLMRTENRKTNSKTCRFCTYCITWNDINCIKRNKISGFPNQNRSSRGFTWVPIDGPRGSAISSANRETTCWSFVPTNMTSFDMCNLVR